VTRAGGCRHRSLPPRTAREAGGTAHAAAVTRAHRPRALPHSLPRQSRGRDSHGLRLACVAGVSGSNLRRRVEAIMRQEIGRPLTRLRRWALAAAIVVVIGGPIAGGALLAQSRVVVAADAPRFDTISIKTISLPPAPDGEKRPILLAFSAKSLSTELAREASNDFRIDMLPLHGLIQAAYGTPPLHIAGGPDWVRSELFAIEATASGTPRPGATVERLRSLLADRFTLTQRRETRTVPVYELVADRSSTGPASPPSSTFCWISRRRAIPRPRDRQSSRRSKNNSDCGSSKRRRRSRCS
jgi:hypothetical protein